MHLVHTRLRPPGRGSGLIARRLESLGEQIRRHTVTFVKAPAGYGKSSVLSQWFHALQEEGAALGWVSLDRTQDDLSDFIRYVVAALQVSRPEFGKWLGALINSAEQPSVAGVATAFVNEVVDADEDIFLFLDDFHLVSEIQVSEALAAIIEHPPDNLHLTIASRQSLPFSISRLRARGQTKEIDGELLRFDIDETGKFLESLGYADLSPSELEFLVTKTEGWAAGIQLAAIALGQHQDRGAFFSILSGEYREIAEYLADDVFDRLPDHTIDFLLKTSVLLRLNTELCAELTGSSESRAELDRLEGQSLFLFSLDQEGSWYRYHHLFSEFLQRRLRDLDPGLITEQHKKASDWFARNNYLDEAFHHAIEADDPIRAAKLLDRFCAELFYMGQLSKLLSWSKKIPLSVITDYPRVQLEIAWSIILEWRFRDAETIIDDVERRVGALAKKGQCDLEKISEIILHRRMMLHMFMDDMINVEKIILEGIHDFPTDDPYLRGTLESCLIHARREMYRLENIDKMDAWAREFFEKSGSIFVLVWHESVMGPTYHLRGDTDLAERSLRSAMEIAERIEGPLSPLAAMPALLLADILYQQNLTEQTAELIERFGEQAEKRGFVDHLIAFYVIRARLQFRDGQQKDAVKTLEQGRLSAERRGFVRLGARIDLELIRQSILTSDLSETRRFLDRWNRGDHGLPLNPGPQTTSSDEAIVLAWCRAKCAVGEGRDTLKTLRNWTVFVRDRGAVRSEVRFLIALTSCLAVNGSEGEALRTLREAVKKAAKPRFIRCFIDEGPVLEGLLRKLFWEGAEVSGATTEFGLDLIKSIAQESATGTPDVDSDSAMPPDVAPPEALNQVERDMLRLVATGMSNKEVAQRLGLTEGSVKWYMQQIFMKLDVRRRTLAVRRAQQFGMV